MYLSVGSKYVPFCRSFWLYMYFPNYLEISLKESFLKWPIHE